MEEGRKIRRKRYGEKEGGREGARKGRGEKK